MTYREATESFGGEAKASLQKELQNVFKRALVPVNPNGVDPADLLPGHALVNLKEDAKGVANELKTRLAAGGNHQNKEDVPERSSPTIDYPKLLAVETYAIHHKWVSIVTDVTGAYLHATEGGEAHLCSTQPCGLGCGGRDVATPQGHARQEGTPRVTR